MPVTMTWQTEDHKIVGPLGRKEKGLVQIGSVCFIDCRSYFDSLLQLGWLSLNFAVANQLKKPTCGHIQIADLSNKIHSINMVIETNARFSTSP